MPNWVDCAVGLYSTNKDDIKRLQSRVKYVLKHDMSNTKYSSKNGFGAGWLGNILAKHHIKWDKTRCRGWIDDVSDIYQSKDYYYVIVYTQTAWSAITEPWDAILKKSYKSVQYVTCALDENMSWGVNTDVDNIIFSDRYYVSLCYPNPEPKSQYDMEYIDEYCEDTTNVINFINSIATQLGYEPFAENTPFDKIKNSEFVKYIEDHEGDLSIIEYETDFS